MANHDFTCADVARLVRFILKESFTETKFSVQSHTYALGQSISVCWFDGPTEKQVEEVTNIFCGQHGGESAEQHSVFLTLDGIPLSIKLDHVIVRRVYSDDFTQRAIDRLYMQHYQAFKLHNIDRPTIEEFHIGELWRHQIVVADEGIKMSVHELLNRELHTFTEVTGPTPSRTLGRLGCVEGGAK